MLTTALILLLVAFTGVDATCQCYITPDSTVTNKKVGISNAFDDSDFSACFASACGFIANSGNTSVGWTTFTATFNTQTDPTGKFIIYDGLNGDANTAQIATFKVSQSGDTIPLTSSTSSIYIKYTQDDTTKPNQYYGTLNAGSGLAAPTTTAAPTSAPTTRAFNNPSFAKDPYLISHDLLILVNQKTTQGAAGLNALNNLTTQFVDLLSVTSSLTGTSQSRLGLATLTPYSPNYAAQGEIWNMNPSDVINALPKAGVSSNVDIITALNQVVPAFFNVSDTVAPTRRGVQRSVLLFTAWWGDAQDLAAVKKTFNDYGVNLAIVGYNTASDSLTTGDWYNYVSLTDTTVADVASFVNRFYLNSGLNNNLANNWCKKSSDPSLPNAIITEPNNYNGPSSGEDSWGTTDGQFGRYCNFQDTTYTFTRKDATKNVSVTVYYELEIENDFVKFFADGKEIESFTGFDVSNANFVVNATVITARFTTDSSGVERGFSATFNEV